MKEFWKNERFVSVSLNAVILLLLAAIFLQCGIFLNGYIKAETDSGARAFDMRMLSVSAQDAARSLNDALLMPAEIAISSGGEAHAVVNSAMVIADLYGELSPCLRACFEADPKKESDATWSLTVTSPDVVYIRYHAELPYQVVHAFSAAASGADSYVRRDKALFVRELCMRFTGGDAFVFIRGESGVYSFAAKSDISMSSVAAYTSMYRDVFYPCTLDGGSSALLLTERVTAREMLVTGGVGASVMQNETHLNEWLRLFSFNPDKLNYHVETDGTTVYVESHGVLTWAGDVISYTASDGGGINIAELAFVRGDVDVYAYLRTASALISEIASMHPQYVGGDGALRLGSVRADGASITLCFALCADNLPVYYAGDDLAVSMTFTGDRLTAVTWQSVSVQRQLSEQVCFLEAWSRNVLASDDVRLAYRADAERTKTAAEWIARRAAEG